MARALYPTPIIGSIGIYEFMPPLDTTESELLECTGIRTISDYTADNQDPYTLAYKDNGLTEADYEKDAAVNIEIVTFRNDGGYTYHIPARFIAKFPIQDGVNYHAVSFVIAVPGMKVGMDFTTVMDALQDTVVQHLGVDSEIQQVATTKARPIEAAESESIETERQLVVDGNIDIYAQVTELETENDELRDKVAALEAYIIANAL